MIGDHIALNKLKALVLLRVDSRIEKKVINEIKSIENVIEAHYIYGPYDMYALVSVDSEDELQDIVLNKLRNLYGVVSTLTCYLAE
ncbi:MAG TPA: Lrp/AsnC ligand binding domain-containing protein [Candidatus Bathyarchaeia archaeon]